MSVGKPVSYTHLDVYKRQEVNRIGSRIYFITITKEGTLPELEVESVKLPVMSLSRLAALSLIHI